jgi:hypothetical protein
LQQLVVRHALQKPDSKQSRGLATLSCRRLLAVFHLRPASIAALNDMSACVILHVR